MQELNQWATNIRRITRENVLLESSTQRQALTRTTIMTSDSLQDLPRV